jgi:hypothetical protein
MSDLGSQLRDYIDGVADPIRLHETSTIIEGSHVRSRHRSRRAVFVAVVAISVVALVTAVIFLRSDTNTTIVSPAHQVPGVALTPLGPADCSRVTNAGETLLLAVTVPDAHTICVTQRANMTIAYLNGRETAHSSGITPLGQGTSFLGGIGTDRGRLIILGNLLNSANSLQLTFCNGQTLDLLPLNTTTPRFVAGAIDTDKYGNPGSQQMDSAGRPLGDRSPTFGSGHAGPCTPRHTSQAPRRASP